MKLVSKEDINQLLESYVNEHGHETEVNRERPDYVRVVVPGWGGSAWANYSVHDGTMIEQGNKHDRELETTGNLVKKVVLQPKQMTQMGFHGQMPETLDELEDGMASIGKAL